MVNILFKACLISCLAFTLLGCATRGMMTPGMMSRLEQGKRDFNDGYFKSAMHELLPLACDGSAEAQYAVGYMYYYGYGVGQDTDVGYFWIKRSADKHYPPAQEALHMIETQGMKKLHEGESGRYKP